MVKRSRIGAKREGLLHPVLLGGTRFSVRPKLQHFGEPVLRANALPPRLYRSAAD
jgi:hypothetical protein